MAEAARRSGSWLACRPGCFECCIGPFPITQLDAIRLREGLAALEGHDALRADRVRRRALASVERIRRECPVDPIGSVLAIEEAAEDELCPALDPDTHTCDLYEARPIACRTFGPAVRFGPGSLALCELCYRGASDAQIAACAVVVDPENVEEELLRDLAANGRAGETIVAFALVEAS
ncbi:MAG TPA: YkgJ family cysteine cluster protein [Bryobacteraceae bacterium]|jgi:Fe-S-cluster containining protein